MEKITINPDIAVWVDIATVPYKKEAEILFTASSNWVGSFDFKVWNSDVKNTEFQCPEALSVENKVMTLTIKPEAFQLKPGSYYYEISSIDEKVDLFVGNLKIRR